MNIFNRVKIQTPESVELEFTLAGIGSRTYALCLDYLYWLLSLVILIILYLIFFAISVNFLQDLLGGDRLELWGFAILGLIFFFVYVGYFAFFETLWQGQTPGKRQAKIRVIRDDGRPVGLPQATLRSLLRPVDDLLFIGMFMIMFGQREKRIGDWVAGTLVVQDEEAVASAEFSFSEKADSLADRLLEATDISGLSPDDFALIREYLRRRSSLFSEAKVELSYQITQRVQTALNLEKMPKGVTAELFLEAVYLAYQKR
ncbi:MULTISPECIES: RDD family protein [Planktothricoides]|uniref:RDD family protein n=2 Tax=Planktothricoides raciborskii TaxID=132608 RepID=A0AAU8JDX9_9CYAN|nr:MULTISPECIES: RDD family protein [Planktothricoides]KOR35732.1 hypothetical protein AM228_16960 [Planktothricoides sp. SR001]MBD2545764.1 RDD family protein [Planktothricoides raciborskii FACHB-1370]MBD2584015.1 RDD family protein [Planktothricoides raciborskii FACHB-1261]